MPDLIQQADLTQPQKTPPSPSSNISSATTPRSYDISSATTPPAHATTSLAESESERRCKTKATTCETRATKTSFANPNQFKPP